MTLPFAIHMAFHTHPSHNTQTNTHTELMYSYCLQTSLSNCDKERTWPKDRKLEVSSLESKFVVEKEHKPAFLSEPKQSISFPYLA